MVGQNRNLVVLKFRMVGAKLNVECLDVGSVMLPML